MRFNLISKVLFLLFCLNSSLAKAEDPAQLIGSPYEDNRIDSLHYRNPKGGWFAGIDFVTLFEEEDIISQTSYSGYSVMSGIQASYGLLDDFLIGVSERYLFNKTLTNLVSSSSQASGFSNPNLELDYRYLGNLKGRIFGTVFFTISPSLGDARIADANQKGNNLSGSTNFTFGTNFQFVWGPGEFNLGVTSSSRTDATFKASKAANSYTVGRNSRGVFNGSFRFHFANDFYASVSANLDLKYQAEITTPTDNGTLTYSTDFSPAFELGWKLSPRSVCYIRYYYYGPSSTVQTPSISQLDMGAQNFIVVGLGEEF